MWHEIKEVGSLILTVLITMQFTCSHAHWLSSFKKLCITVQNFSDRYCNCIRKKEKKTNVINKEILEKVCVDLPDLLFDAFLELEFLLLQ